MQYIDSITETAALEGELDFENEIFWTGGDTVFKSAGSVQSITELAGIQFSRRSAKSVFGRNGHLVEVMPDTPAVQHDFETGKNPRLLIEKAAVNLFRNPGWRGLKASADVSAKPIAEGGYVAAAAPGGVIESISAGAEFGMEYAELTMRATPSAQTSFKLILGGSGGPSAIHIEGGAQYTCSAYIRAVSGGENMVSCYWRCITRDASGAVNSTYNGLDGRFQARSSRLFRLVSSDPPLIAEDNSCTFQPYLQFVLEGGAHVRLRIYHHQCEPGSVATSPIVQGSKYPYARAPDMLRIASFGHKTKGFTVHADARAEGDTGVILAAASGHALIEKRGRFMAASTSEDYRTEATAGVGSLDDAVPRKFTLCHFAGKTALKVSEGRLAVVKSKIHHLGNMVLASSSIIEISRLAWWPHGTYFHSLDDAHPPQLRTDPPPAAKPARARVTAAQKLTQSNRVVHFIPVYLAQSWYLGLYGKKIFNPAPTSWRTARKAWTARWRSWAASRSRCAACCSTIRPPTAATNRPSSRRSSLSGCGRWPSARRSRRPTASVAEAGSTSLPSRVMKSAWAPTTHCSTPSSSR